MASAGRILLIPRGRYSSAETYKPLDIVLHNGASWLCKKEAKGVEPSFANYSYWQIFTEDNYSLEILERLGKKDLKHIGDGTITGAIVDIDQRMLTAEDFSLSEDGVLTFNFL